MTLLYHGLCRGGHLKWTIASICIIHLPGLAIMIGRVSWQKNYLARLMLIIIPENEPSSWHQHAVL